MIEPGKYRGRATGSTPPHVTFGIAGTGTEQIAVNFAILEPDTDDDGIQKEDEHGAPIYRESGEELTWVSSFTPKTERRTLEGLQYAGWSGVDIADLSGLGSTDVELVVDHEEYEGRTRAKIQWVNKAGGMAFKFKTDMPAANFTDLRQRMKGVALGMKDGGPRQPAQQERRPTPTGGSVGGGYRRPLQPGEWDGTGADPNHDGRGPRGSDDDIPF